jgi:hypothetical protein
MEPPRWAFTEKFAKYNGKPTEEDAKNEAVEALLPFKAPKGVAQFWS